MTPSIAITDLRRMTPSELRKELSLKRAALAKMRLGLRMQSDKNHAAYRLAKGDVARMCMALDEVEKNQKIQRNQTNQKSDEKIASKTEKNAVKDPGSTKKSTSTKRKAKKKSSESSASSDSSVSS